MHPGKNNYPVEQQVSNEVAIRSDWLTGEDLFLITEQVNANGTIDFKAIINPLVNLIWLAGLVFLLGSVVTLWPDAREERRLAVRYGRLVRTEASARPLPSSSARCSPRPRSGSSPGRCSAAGRSGRRAGGRSGSRSRSSATARSPR